MFDKEKSLSLKGVIFDLDGTLTDTLPVCIAAFRKALEPLANRSISDAEIIDSFGPSEEGIVGALVPGWFEEGMAAYLRYYDELLNECGGPFDGVVELLDDLRKAGLRLALVTGKGQGSTQLTLTRFGLDRYFTDVEIGSPRGIVKADRIRDVLGRWGMASDEAAYVGDAPSDVAAAREAGVPVVAAAWAGGADPDRYREVPPDLIASRIVDLLAYVKGRMAGGQTSVAAAAQRLQAIAQTGLAFTKDRYDVERYQMLREIAVELMQASGVPDAAALRDSFARQIGYATPKVDVRAIVVRQGRVLLVKEAQDGEWSLPGGWADVGDRPSQAVEREVWEETGLKVEAERLLGLWDRNLHGHPPYPFHVYKLIFLCREVGGELTRSIDSLDLEFFAPDRLPSLSLTRVVVEEIVESVRSAAAAAPAYFD